MSVSVMIPTFRRPDGLRLALQSVLAQSHRPDEIIIVDNSPEASARCIAANASAVARCPVVYVHEPQPGVSNARNAGFAAASGRYLAFLDDDEIASVDWLAALLESVQTLDADVVFGPLRAEIEQPDSLRGQLGMRLYSRAGPAADSLLDEAWGSGNSLVDRDAFELPDHPFDTTLNQTGGEDDAFFALLAAQGARFGWSARAKAVEVVGAARTNWRHLLSRSFAFGQGATQNCARAQHVDHAGIAFWMAVGLAQMLLFAPLALLSLPVRRPLAVKALDKAVQGAGKVFWFSGLEPKFYGQTNAAAAQDPGSAAA
ncbi:glycosyltransferase family 2 protein [uncultured Maricaulis sp.]|uniref:glycosyltransferase family 2 protein n=1 Tax=uncultured Maricaulis sp. TaxID=174710 RepID=UPI0030DB959E|tara:strand:+ start:5224 stop:6168 length:945 start_codon:yes stop_codon:yes gene_type:complete